MEEDAAPYEPPPGAAQDSEGMLVAAPGAPLSAGGPRLPDSCKRLLKDLAEEMLLMHSRQETAEQRAEQAEKKLTRRGVSEGAAADVLRRQAAASAAQADALQLQLEEAQRQVEQERRLRQAAERRVAELEQQLAAARPQGRRQRQEQQQPAQQQQQARPDADARQLGLAMLAGGRGGAASPQRQQQQQQQQQRQQQPVDRPMPPEQPGAAPAGDAAAGGHSSDALTLHSSDDDETFRTAVPGHAAAAGAGAAAAAAAGGPAQAENGKEEGEPAAARAQPASMRPPPQRLGTLRGAVNPAKQAASRKRPAEGGLAAAAAAAGRAQAARRGEAAPPAKQQRREAPAAAGEARRESRGGNQQRPDSASPGDSVLDALDALGGRRMRRSSSAAATAAAGGSALSPTSEQAGPDLLLRLADAGQDGWEGEEEEEGGEGLRRRGGRRGAGAVAGAVTLKPGETAQQWLNRHIVAYVGTLARERDFRPFEKPVPRTTPDYHRLVTKPMDLATVKIKAQRQQYTSPREFRADLLLIVNNAKFYNESQKHPVHQAADRLHDYLHKPHSFFNKVEGDFKQAETAEVLNEQRAAQEVELEQEEAQLAHSVQEGSNIAVYAGEDDINGNRYYLLQAVGRSRKLRAEDTDDFGTTYEKGEEVIEGHYYDYWVGPDGGWDRRGGRRPYYLQDDRRALVPASSLLMVDFEMQEREEPEMSPFDGVEQAVYDVTPDLHKQLKRAIKKFTAEPAGA